jgi:hypothetical protein
MKGKISGVVSFKQIDRTVSQVSLQNIVLITLSGSFRGKRNDGAGYIEQLIYGAFSRRVAAY